MKKNVGIYKNRTNVAFSWEANFPPVYGHTSVSYLKHCPGFERAKNGDFQAAADVVDMCIKPSRIADFRKKYSNSVLLPIITNNRLPEAFARKVGMNVHTGVYASDTRCRKTLSAMERLLHKPYFAGKISAGVDYVIVDDVVTQGGTISELRKYVMLNGSTITAVTALAFSADSRIIAPDTQDIYSLINKFTYSLIIDILRKYRIADDVWELTRPQVRYLLRFEKTEHLINSMEKISDKSNT